MYLGVALITKVVYAKEVKVNVIRKITCMTQDLQDLMIDLGLVSNI